MKYFVSILILFSFYHANAQSSYQESLFAVDYAFNSTFSAPETKGVSQKFVISAKDDYAVNVQMGPFKTLSLLLEEAFKQADCESCEEVSEKLTEKPIKYIYQVIEYQDVFLITEYEDQYKVIRYQPKEEN